MHRWLLFCLFSRYCCTVKRVAIKRSTNTADVIIKSDKTAGMGSSTTVLVLEDKFWWHWPWPRSSVALALALKAGGLGLALKASFSHFSQISRFFLLKTATEHRLVCHTVCF